MKMPKMFKEDERIKERTVYDIQDSDLNSVLPDLLSVNGDVKLHEHVNEINGVKTILYDATLLCNIEQFYELRVRLGTKGFTTKIKPEEKK